MSELNTPKPTRIKAPRWTTPEGRLISWGKYCAPGVDEKTFPRYAYERPDQFPVGRRKVDFKSYEAMQGVHATNFLVAVRRKKLFEEFPHLNTTVSDGRENEYPNLLEDPRIAFTTLFDVRYQLGSKDIAIVQTSDVLNFHYKGISLPPSSTGYSMGRTVADLAEDIYLEHGDVKIFEMGVGSGIIMASALRNYGGENMTYIGGDIDERCLSIADLSMQVNGFDPETYTLRQGSLLEPIDSERVHMIVSNPPYFPRSMATANDDIGPGLALDGGDDGLDFYRRIFEQAIYKLVPGGKILVQVSNVNLQQVRELAEGYFGGHVTTQVVRHGGRRIKQFTNKGKGILVEFAP
ncbi:methyltransferase [Candidatus Peregrinibacteria bacterium]|nr:methyltransferase [Candidatus Peregrinibacteria bacterium]